MGFAFRNGIARRRPAQDLPEHGPVTVIEPKSRSADSFYISSSNVIPHCSTSYLPHHHLFLVNSNKLSVFAVEDNDEIKSATAPNKKTIFKGCLGITDARLHAATRGTVMDHSDGKLYLLSFFENKDCLISLFNANPRPPQEENHSIELDFVSTTLEHPRSVNMALVEFSAFLGRYCLLTPEGDVVIMDY